MSTNSNIIVKVNKSDIGSTALFDASKLDASEVYWGKTNSNENGVEKPVEITEEYIGTYCHWDGYINGVGKALKEHFNTYDKALNLVLGGSCSAIGGNGGIIRFATRKGEKWKDLKPKQSDNPSSLAEEEYNYLFEDGKWKWFNDGTWKEF